MRNIFTKSQYPSDPIQLVPVRQPSLVALASSKLERIPELWRDLFLSIAPRLVTEGHVTAWNRLWSESSEANELWLKRNAWVHYNLVNCTQLGTCMLNWLQVGEGPLESSVGPHARGPEPQPAPHGSKAHACGGHRRGTGPTCVRPTVDSYGPFLCHMNLLSHLLYVHVTPASLLLSPNVVFSMCCQSTKAADWARLRLISIRGDFDSYRQLKSSSNFSQKFSATPSQFQFSAGNFFSEPLRAIFGRTPVYGQNMSPTAETDQRKQ